VNSSKKKDGILLTSWVTLRFKIRTLLRGVGCYWRNDELSLLKLDPTGNTKPFWWTTTPLCWRALRAHVTSRAALASAYVPVRTALARQVTEQKPEKCSGGEGLKGM
jgi:hypothetical protein